MNDIKKKTNLQSILLGILIIIAALIGIFYSSNGMRFQVTNMYGDTVDIYGNGIYAYNSILNVSSRLGADVTGIIAAVILIVSTLLKNRPLWVEIIRTSVIICLAYYSSLLLFGVTMNRLYFLYAACFGVALFTSFIAVKDLFSIIKISKALKEEKFKGLAVFLIITSVIVALVWVSCVLPAVLNGNFGSLLGIQTNEITYGIDFSITCPLLIMCAVWILQKKELGYKVALILLNLLIFVALLVIMQRAYCIKLGVEIPIQALISLIISFIVLGVIALYFEIKLIKKL